MILPMTGRKMPSYDSSSMPSRSGKLTWRRRRRRNRHPTPAIQPHRRRSAPIPTTHVSVTAAKAMPASSWLGRRSPRCWDSASLLPQPPYRVVLAGLGADVLGIAGAGEVLAVLVEGHRHHLPPPSPTSGPTEPAAARRPRPSVRHRRRPVPTRHTGPVIVALQQEVELPKAAAAHPQQGGQQMSRDRYCSYSSVS